MEELKKKLWAPNLTCSEAWPIDGRLEVAVTRHLIHSLIIIYEFPGFKKVGNLLNTKQETSQ